MMKRVRKPTFGPMFSMVAERKAEGRVTSASDAFDLLKADAQSNREWLQVLYLDPKNQLIHQGLEAIGSIDCSAVYPREIARRALAVGATALVIAHNHPSGDPEPSLCDRELTRDLVWGLALLQIKVLDHLIIGARFGASPQRYFSFADQGLIDDYRTGFENYSPTSATPPR